MASLDLKDAYYSVPIHTDSQKFLKFFYQGNFFKFTAFPNGLSSCPRKFTKLFKPILATLRLEGHIIICYIDDLFLLGKSYNECVSTIIDTFTLLESLGFGIHPDKSVFIPTQRIVFLGYLIDSHSMTIRLTSDKVEKLTSLIQNILTSASKVKIRSVAQVIGHMVASFPAVKYGPLYYRMLGGDKTTAVYVVNNMGNSHNDKCNAITVAIWEYCMAEQIYITAAHLRGSTNIVADRESRICYREAEWMLNSNYLKTALLELEFQPEIDLFASRLNKQFTNYCSYRPDPEALYIDAFSIPWNNQKFYCVPPFGYNQCARSFTRKQQWFL